MSTFCKVPLGEVVNLQSGVGFPLDLQGRNTGDYPFAKVGDISRVGRLGKVLISVTDHYVDKDDLVILRARPVPEGSILFAKIGEAMSHNHRVIAGRDMLIDNNAMAAVPTPRVISRYLYYFLRTVNFYRLASTTTVPSLRKTELEKVNIPLPSLKEQRRIADILDKAHALRAKRLAALAELDSLTQSIFLDLFGDPAINPKRWPTCTIGDLLESASYGTSKKSAPSGAFPVLRMNNITRTGEMDFTDLKFMDLEKKLHDRYLVRAGDVLFNRTNSAELVGKSGLYCESKPMAYAGYLIRLRVNNENVPRFLWAFLNCDYSKRMLRNMCKSIIGMANINAAEIQAMKIPRPPLTLQREFATRVAAVEKLKATQRASLAEMDALFASLQHRAFNGQL